MSQEQKPKAKPKGKKREKPAGPEIVFDVGETFEPSKEEDFDLNVKEMMYTAKAGQAGTRCKATNFDGKGKYPSGGDPARATNDA